MQDLKFNCPRCKQSLEAPEEYFGQSIECPSCNSCIHVPNPKVPSIPPLRNSSPPIPLDAAPSNTRPCQFCGEQVLASAIKCKHCGEFFAANHEIKTNVKQGALIGATVCLIIGLVMMYFSLLTFIVYVPIFIAAFTLSIVAMAQKRVISGIALLLLTLIVPPLMFFGLGAVRSQQALNDFSAAMDLPIAKLKPPSIPATLPTEDTTPPAFSYPTTPPNSWRLDTSTSPIDGSTTYILQRDAEDKAGTGFFASTPTLIIRHKEGRLDFYITFRQYLGSDGTLVTSRLDSSPADESEWSISTDGKAIFCPGNIYETIEQLMANDKLVIRLTPYGESPITATFNLTGLTEALEPMKSLIK